MIFYLHSKQSHDILSAQCNNRMIHHSLEVIGLCHLQYKLGYLSESWNLLEASFQKHHAPFFRPKCLTLRGHVTALTTVTWQQKFIVDGGSSYPWSRFMAGCTILISMASLTFLFNQLSSLTSTLTLSLVIVWCSCVQCSPTAVSGFLRLRWSFILVASILPVSPMYVRGFICATIIAWRLQVMRSWPCGRSTAFWRWESQWNMWFEPLSRYRRNTESGQRLSA